MLVNAKRYMSSTANVKLIAGTTRELGVVVSRQVRAYSHETGILLAQTRSSTGGKYKLYLPYDSSYTLVAVDSRKTFNAVIQDNVVPK